MGKTITCPACGNHGEASDDIAFEVRGQHEGRPVRKCLSCGTGLYLKMLGRPEVIPERIWDRMQEMWDAEFGPSHHTLAEQAADRLVRTLPNHPLPAVGFAFSAPVIGLRQFFPVIARNYDDWKTVDVAALERVFRLAIGPNLLVFLDDDDNRIYLSEALGTHPADTIPELWRIYSEQVLNDEEAGWVSELPPIWVDDPARFAVKMTRILRRVAGFASEDPPIDEAFGWATVFTHAGPTVDDAYWSMLRTLAESA